jgi:hypothetical protein
MVECKYKNRCISHPEKCGSCVNNLGKCDYYQPMPYPNWWPWPWYPYPWYQQPVWYSSNDTQQSSGDYYSNNSDVPVTC